VGFPLATGSLGRVSVLPVRIIARYRPADQPKRLGCAIKLSWAVVMCDPFSQRRSRTLLSFLNREIRAHHSERLCIGRQVSYIPGDVPVLKTPDDDFSSFALRCAIMSSTSYIQKGSISHSVVAEAIVGQPSASYETTDVLSLLWVQGQF